jgi:tetratricopeptide (TPR) repeat protein
MLMRLLALFALLSMPLVATDEARLALVMKAQAEFDRVALAGVSRLEDAGQCVQSQAAALAVAVPADATLLHYRKGFCLMAEAATTQRPGAYAVASDEFDKAIEAWPARTPPVGARKGVTEPVSPGLKVLASIARLKADASAADLERARKELTAAAASPVCSSDVMPALFCQQIVQKGREWLGWMALKTGDLREAARNFSGSAGAWADWTAGREAFADANYPAAVEHYHTAVDRWDVERRQSPPNTLQSFGPRPDRSEALTDLGGAQLLAGNPAAAIATFDKAAHEDPSRARPLYLRARAKEVAGDPAGAQADYSLASRMAFASAQDLASGEAHLYRGILLYRRKDWVRAEDEFSSALNLEIPSSLRGDAEAWRHLAAVAAGGCETSRGYLEHSLESVSPYFPKAEARSMADSCATMESAVIHGPMH